MDYPQAHGPIVSNIASVLWFIAPGYGVYAQSTGCNVAGGGCEGGCETERPHALGRPAEEPKRPRTMFSVAEARALVRDGKLELYDVSGRRAKALKPGVFFQIERTKAGVVTARRTVLVTN